MKTSPLHPPPDKELIYTMDTPAPALEHARRELTIAEASGVGFEEALAKVTELEAAQVQRRAV